MKRFLTIACLLTAMLATTSTIQAGWRHRYGAGYAGMPYCGCGPYGCQPGGYGYRGWYRPWGYYPYYSSYAVGYPGYGGVGVGYW